MRHVLPAILPVVRSLTGVLLVMRLFLGMLLIMATAGVALIADGA